jgi:molybdopterin molybdotransferase
MVRVISVDTYRAAVIELLGVAPPTALPLAECAGLVLAEDVPAGVSLPPFDNSAMDGYAVRAVDVASATAATPVELPVAEDIPAGRTDVPPLLPGSAHRIMTGAPMPSGADAVVKVEDTDGGTGKVSVREPAAVGTHLRRTGEDVAVGTVALRAGTVLGPAQLGLAAAVGLDRLTVHAPLRVLVVSTGSELVTPPGELRHGQIYESNSIMLAAALRGLGCRVDVVRSVVDDVDEFRSVIEPRLAATDLVVTSGGVSAGAYEVVKDSLTGAGVEFVKVAMQPGGPQGAGRWNGVPRRRPAAGACPADRGPEFARGASPVPARVLLAGGRRGDRSGRPARRPRLPPAERVRARQLPDRTAGGRHRRARGQRGRRAAAPRWCVSVTSCNSCPTAGHKFACGS